MTPSNSNFPAELVTAGVQPLEIPAGTKVRSTPWKHLTERLQSVDDVRREWRGGGNVAVICGAVSGNLLCIDIDDLSALPDFLSECQASGVYPRIMEGYHERSPKGYHIFVRGESPVGPSTKLASREDRSTIIETRGENGYCLVHPSPGYDRVSGSLSALPVLSKSEVHQVLTSARLLDRDLPAAVDAPQSTGAVGGDAVGDWQRAVSWHDILPADGWSVHSQRGSTTYWTRPGKKASDGVSATTGFRGQDNLIVFTSNAGPLRAGGNYTKIGWLATARFGGSFKDATKWCRAQGFGYSGTNPKSTPNPAVVDDEDDLGFSAPVTNTRPSAALPPKEEDIELPDEITFGDDDVVDEHTNYLWEPYFPRSKVVLVDADGGTGKTTLMLAIAAIISQGFDPWWMPLPEGPAKTLYLYADSDSPQEMETVYRRSGGKPGHLVMIKGAFAITESSARKIREKADQVGASLVVIDPVLYYMTGTKMDSNSFEQVQPKLTFLAKAFEGANAVCVIVRHTNKAGSGQQELTDPSTAGIGSQAFRAVARGQLVIKRHPEKRGLAIVRDLKGSLLVKEGEPFAFKRNHQGVVEWVPSFDWPEGWKTGKPAHDKTSSDVRDIIGEATQRGPAARTKIESMLSDYGIPWFCPVVQDVLRRCFIAHPPAISTGGEWIYEQKG